MKTANPNIMNKKETRTWATYKRGNVRKTKNNSNGNSHERNIRKPTKSNETHKTANGTAGRNMNKHKKENGQ